MSEGIILGIVVFTLATFLGFELIQRVPPTLHTPLMSGSNAISGITIVGALIIAEVLAGASEGWAERVDLITAHGQTIYHAPPISWSARRRA